MRFLTLLGACLVATGPALAQPDTSSADVLSRLKASGMVLRRGNPDLDYVTSTRLHEITDMTRFLAELNDRSPMPGYYTRTLRAQARLLDEIARSDHLSEWHKTAVWQIAKDLAVKKSFALKNHSSPYEISIDFSGPRSRDKLYMAPLGRYGLASPDRLIYDLEPGQKFKVPPGIFSIQTGELPPDRSEDLGLLKERYLTFGLDGERDAIIPFGKTLPELDKVVSSHKTLERLRFDANTVFDIAKQSGATELARALEKNTSRSTFLHDLAVTKPMPKAYFETLASQATVYNRIFQEGKIGTTATKLLFAISFDLEAKEAFARKNPDDPYESVVVAATTKDSNNAEVPGYEVWYVGSAYCCDTNRYRRYDDNSSPTSQKLSPGYWYMWTQVPEKPDSRGAVKPVTVGEGGEKEQGVDLPIPDASTPAPRDCCDALH